MMKMAYRMNKRASMNVLVGLLIAIISFASIMYVISVTKDSYDIDEQIAMTRASLLVAEKTEIGPFFRPDLYLKTHFFPIPESNYGSSKEEVLKNIAERVKDCWWEFGNGQVSSDVLDGALFKTNKDKCFICFVPTIEKLDQPFYFSDLMKYMAEQPAAAKEEDMCVKEEKDDDKRKIQLSKDENCEALPECEAKGGQCRVSQCDNNELIYRDWECQYNRKCCVPKDHLMSYIQYIQDGNGVLYLANEFVNDKQIMISQGTTLAIIFKDRTKLNKAVDFTLNAAEFATSFLGVGYALNAFKIGGKLIALVSKFGTLKSLAVGGSVAAGVNEASGGSSLIAKLFVNSYPQGVMITPYPSDEYGNCMIVDPNNQ